MSALFRDADRENWKYEECVRTEAEAAETCRWDMSPQEKFPSATYLRGLSGQRWHRPGWSSRIGVKLRILN
ncbi:Uncharacterized protein dnm_076980 [Desulfonema magnum]|uniref:Uncharacterized protein n=1 Tax=Desulfonema magnum TaxID=45655 RepID=A0A975BTV6_9BACT|nr:Uncharacterized protein dnm_076980 [Desulfonema magnum]